MRLSSLLLASSLATACGGASTTAVRETRIELNGPTVVRLLEGALPVVHVTLDGRGELPFVVDSAASVSAIDLSQVEELGLSVGTSDRAASARGSGGGLVSYDKYVRVDRLRVGALTLENTRLPAIESSIFGELDLVGVLGQDLLDRLIVLFDTNRRELHLLPPEPEGPSILSYLSEAEVGVGTWTQATVELRPCPYLPFAVDSRFSGELKVDTGSMGTTFPQAAIDALGLESTATVTGHGLDGTFQTTTYELEEFNFYEFMVSCEIRCSRQEYGLLGMNVLGQFVFLLDGPGRELWLHHRTRCEFWAGASLHVLCVAPEGEEVTDDPLERVGAFLTEARIDAEVSLVTERNADAIAQHSADATIVLCPFRIRSDVPCDPFGGDDLERLLSRLPVTALGIAAEDLQLTSEPDEGSAADAAAARDRVLEAETKARKADEEAAAAEQELERARSAEPDTAAQDPGTVDQLAKEAEKASRRAAKARAKALSARQEAGLAEDDAV